MRVALEELRDSLWHTKNIKVWVLRLDQIDILTGGNKYFKLKYNIEQAIQQGYSSILSLGGAYSNHIAALAKVGYDAGIQTIGLIRGNELNPQSNPTLSLAQRQGMKFHFIDRAHYRNKSKEEFIQEWHDLLGEFYFVPEGGSNVWALKGCQEIVQMIPEKFDYILTPCGTGGTIAGISLALNPSTQAIGIPVLKNAYFLEQDILHLQELYKQKFNQALNLPTLIYDYHFGGYAKKSMELKQFQQYFQTHFSIPLDPIYNIKSFYALFDLLKKDYFKHGSSIVMVHTGGLQCVQ